MEDKSDAKLKSITELPMSTYDDIAGNKDIDDFEKQVMLAYSCAKCSFFAIPALIRPFQNGVFAFPAHSLFLNSDECLDFVMSLEDEDAGRLSSAEMVKWIKSTYPLFKPAGDGLYIKDPAMPEEVWHFVKMAVFGAIYAQIKQLPVMICKEGVKGLVKKKTMPAVIRKVWLDIMKRSDIQMDKRPLQ